MACGDWERLGREETCSTVGSIDVTCLAVKKNLEVISWLNNCGSVVPTLRFNNDSGTEYSWGRAKNGQGVSTCTNQTGIAATMGGGYEQFRIEHIVNIPGQEKLVIGHSVGKAGGGECVAPQREEYTGKYDPTCLATNITQVNVDNDGGSTIASGSAVTVWGAQD